MQKLTIWYLHRVKTTFGRKQTKNTVEKKYRLHSGAFFQYFQGFPHFCLQCFYTLFCKTLLASCTQIKPISSRKIQNSQRYTSNTIWNLETSLSKRQTAINIASFHQITHIKHASEVINILSRFLFGRKIIQFNFMKYLYFQ